MPRFRHDNSSRPQTLRRITAGILVLGLAACGTAPKVPTDEAPASAPAAKRSAGGGYYLDDGPGDGPPPNLDDIPDAQPRDEPLHRFANRPYVALGQEYVPATERKPYRKRGMASWYGRRFHGKPTSSGEPYDMYGMTAAHPTLPIPSYARVTNLANGRSVVVRINDRGPFLHGRLIDLSYAAARKLGYLDKGSAMVEVEAVDPEVQALQQPAREAAATPTPAATTQTTDESARLYVQLGAFTARANAESLRTRIMRDVSDALDRAVEVIAHEGLFRVRLGPYTTPTEAAGVAERLREALNMKPYIVR